MDMPEIDRAEILWKLSSTGAGILTAIAVRAVMRSLWEAIRHEEPPANPAAPFTGWGDAIIWSASVGMGVAAGRLLARRVAVEGWERITGSQPPGLADPRRLRNRIRDRVHI